MFSHSQSGIGLKLVKHEEKMSACYSYRCNDDAIHPPKEAEFMLMSSVAAWHFAFLDQMLTFHHTHTCQVYANDTPPFCPFSSEAATAWRWRVASRYVAVGRRTSLNGSGESRCGALSLPIIPEEDDECVRSM